jgi:hypothetical protein
MQSVIHSRGIGLLLACLMGGAVLRAQQPETIQRESGAYTLHADTHLVLLDVTVMDKKGQPVAGLTKDDFNLLEDGQPQTIKFFEEHAPVDPAEIAKEKAAALAAQIKLLDEQIVPVDAAEIARQKAATIAGQPPNTFTNYEPFTGRPVTVLLLNELFPRGYRTRRAIIDGENHGVLARPSNGFVDPLHKKMLDLVRSAPSGTPFTVYLLDSQLRLVQPITTDRALLLARIDLLWKSPTPDFGSEQMVNPTGLLSEEAEIPVRRRISADAMQQLASSLEGVQGRKNLYVFTGAFQCSVVASPRCPGITFTDANDYLCGLMDALEQGRMSIYRYYGEGNEFAHGFGCSRSVDLGASANYYTLYYTPTNGDWNGKYRATEVEVAEKDLHLLYRKGYYGTPENVEAHYYAAKRPAPAAVASSSGRAGSGGSTIAASTVAAGTAAPESPGTGATPAPPNPVSSVFTVQVVPASATSAKDKEKEESRQLTLRFSMPASEFKVVQSGSGQYVARPIISAVGYSDGKVASSNGSQAVQMVANFNGAADPRIATSTITAELKLNELERGKDRWLLLTVRDQATGQFGSMVIPMEQVKMPGTQ